MLLGEEGGHGGKAEDEVVAGDAEEHQGAHGLAAGHEGAEDEEKGCLDGTHTGHVGQSVGEEEHQAGEQLHLPEAEAAGQTHEPDAEIGQGVHQKELEGVQREDLDAAALVGEEVAALGAEGVQLLQPFFPAGLPGVSPGQVAQCPAGQPLDEGRYADQHQRHDDGGHHSIGHGQIVHHAGGVGGEPPVLQQQHHGGVKQNGGLVEDVLQGHQTHAGAKRQAAAVEVVGLHRHGTGTQADDVAEGAHERRFQRLPHGEAGHPAADDDPADQTFQYRVTNFL